jgi:hypothetical protein
MLDALKSLILVYVGLPFLAAPEVIAVRGIFTSNIALELFTSLEALPVIALAGWSRAV